MSLFIIILFISTGVTLTLAVQAWCRGAALGSRALFFLQLTVAVASFSYAMNVSALTLEDKLFWNRVEYLGAAYIPTLMLTVALAITGPRNWLLPGPLAGLFALPAMAMLANWTNGWHGLYYTRTWLEPGGTLVLLAKARGPLYLLNFGYAYAALALALFFIVRALRRPGLTPRPQLALLLAAFLIPILLNLPYTLRWMPTPHVNLTLVGFFCAALLLSIAIFRFRLIAALPLEMEERNQMLLSHAHAIFYTIGPDGIMTYVSPNWPNLLGHAPEEVTGRSFSVFVLPEDHAACHAFLERVVATGTLQTGVEYRVVHKSGEIRWHTSSILPVNDSKGRLLAYVGAAHDITRLKQTQQELHVANERLTGLIASREAELRQAIREALTAAESEARRIGQDIHDGLCQDLIGIVRLAEVTAMPAEDQCRPCREAMARIREQATRLACIARAFSHDLTLHELEVQTLSEALETLARRTDQVFDTETEINLSDPIIPLPRDQHLHLYRIVREAVANAVKHAHARHLWIELVREPHQFVVSVSNDGLPLPDPGQLIEGLGLRQMQMRARLLGASFSLRRNDANLAVMELIVPLEDPQGL